MDRAPNLFKTLTLVFGTFNVLVGSYAHFESQWTDFMKSDLYKECGKAIDKICPPRSMELYFVSITIIATAGSIAMLIALLIRKEAILDKVDAIFHLCAGLLVFIGGIVLIVSANQIWNVVEAPGVAKNDNQLYDQKIVTGILSTVNGICYIVVGVLTGVTILKELKKNDKMNMDFPYAKSSTASAPYHGHLN